MQGKGGGKAGERTVGRKSGIIHGSVRGRNQEKSEKWEGGRGNTKRERNELRGEMIVLLGRRILFPNEREREAERERERD